MKAISPKILSLFAAIIPSGAFMAALVNVIPQTAPEWAVPPAAEPAAPLPDRSYVELDEPLLLGIYEGRIQISVNLAFAARLTGLQLLDLSARVTEKQDAIMSELTSAALDLAEGVTDSKDLGVRLRAELPPVLLQLVNTGLATAEMPEPVEEVMILDLTVNGG